MQTSLKKGGWKLEPDIDAILNDVSRDIATDPQIRGISGRAQEGQHVIWDSNHDLNPGAHESLKAIWVCIEKLNFGYLVVFQEIYNNGRLELVK